MLRIRKLIQLLERGYSVRQISRELKMGRNVVSVYLKRVESSAKSHRELLSMDDACLSGILSCKACDVTVLKADPRLGVLEPLLGTYASELDRTGVTKQLLWEEYTRDYSPDTYGYTQFKIHLNRYLTNHTCVYHNQHHPRREMQVDFAGDHLYINEKGEVRHACPVLVCTLPYSGYTFVIALYDARQESFYYGLSKALEYFDGVPDSVKSDNMKQWVTRSDRYEPTFADATLGWGVHYQTELVATRVAKPRDKGHVECHVNIIYQRVHARLRNESFPSVSALNVRVTALLEEHNSKPMQGRSQSRSQKFIQEEKNCLKPLASTPYLFKYRKEFTVNSTYHVQITADEHFYSIPFRHIGKKATMVYDYVHVEMYIGLERVAVHTRSSIRGGYSTQEEHMPEKHRAYKRSLEYNAQYYLDKASLIGPCTRESVERILGSKVFVQQAYRSCQGLISLVRKYPSSRVEAACLRATQSPTVSYTMIKNILEKNLDTVALCEETQKVDAGSLCDHENIRGASHYQ